jgi:ethanolamine utilization cobalamin adenosyltransferase
MKKGGAPSSQRAATQKRLRDKEVEENPDVKTQRKEDAKEAKRMFFTRDTGRQSLPNFEIEMSGEPSATPVFTTRITSVQDPFWHLTLLPKS